MEEALLKIAEIGGPAVTIVALFIFYLWQREKMTREKEAEFTKIISNHLAHETASRDKLTEALTSLVEVVRGCPKK